MAQTVRNDALVLSAQSLREYYFTVARKDRLGHSLQELRSEIAILDTYVPDLLRRDHLKEAWALQDRHRFSFWDGLLIAAALASGCTIFLSEDMHGGQQVDTLTIVNPFLTAPVAVFG